jgi:hypothetical protein
MRAERLTDDQDCDRVPSSSLLRSHCKADQRGPAGSSSARDVAPPRNSRPRQAPEPRVKAGVISNPRDQMNDDQNRNRLGRRFSPALFSSVRAFFAVRSPHESEQSWTGRAQPQARHRFHRPLCLRPARSPPSRTLPWDFFLSAPPLQIRNYRLRARFSTVARPPSRSAMARLFAPREAPFPGRTRGFFLWGAWACCNRASGLNLTFESG